jgi:hypothetical protein
MLNFELPLHSNAIENVVRLKTGQKIKYKIKNRVLSLLSYLVYLENCEFQLRVVRFGRVKRT